MDIYTYAHDDDRRCFEDEDHELPFFRLVYERIGTKHGLAFAGSGGGCA